MMNTGRITDQSYFIDYFQLDHGYKQSYLDNPSEPSIVDNDQKQLEAAPSLPYEHTEKYSIVDTITITESQEWKESQQVDKLKTFYGFSTFQKDPPPGATTNQTRLTKGTNNSQSVEYTTWCTQETLSQTKPAGQTLLQEHPHLTSCTTKDVAEAGELHLNESSNASHSFNGKIQDSKDDDNRLYPEEPEMEHLETKTKDAKEHTTECTQETLFQTKPVEKMLLQEHPRLTSCTTKDVAESGELHQNESSKLSHSFYGKIRDLKDDDNRLNPQEPEMEHLETIQKDGRKVLTVTPINLAKLISEAPTAFSGTKVKEGTKKPQRVLSPEVKTPEVARVTSMQPADEAIKLASNKTSMFQETKQCNSKDDCDKLQRWPVHRRQVKEMVTLKFPKISSTKDRAATFPNHKVVMPMDSRETDRDKAEDCCSPNRTSTSLSENQTSTTHLTKETYIKHSKRHTLNPKSTPQNVTAMSAGGDEPNGRKVGQSATTTTRDATKVESVRVNKVRRPLGGRLKQPFVKHLRNQDLECTSRDRLWEGNKQSLMSKWKRRQKRNRIQDNVTVEATCNGYTSSKSEKQMSRDEHACGSLHVDNSVKIGEPGLPERGYLEDIDFVVNEFDMILRTKPELPARDYLEDIDFVSEEFELFFRRKSKQEKEESTQSRESTSSAEEGFVPQHPMTDDEHLYDQNAGGMPGVRVDSHYQPLMFNKGEQSLHQESEYVELPPLDASLLALGNVQNPVEGPHQSLPFEGEDPQNKYDHECASFKAETSKLRDTSRSQYQPLAFDSGKKGIINTKPLKSSKMSPSTFMMGESNMNIPMSYPNTCSSAPDSDNELPNRRQKAFKHSLSEATEIKELIIATPN